MELSFSDAVAGGCDTCTVSPDGKFIAACAKYKLIVRDVDKLEIIALWQCDDAIRRLEWSCDSKYILCGQYKRGLVQVFSLEDPTWNCRIDEGPAGLTHSRWSPDGRHILNVADFQLRVSVWSLLDKSVRYIQYPKFSSHGLDFSPNGEYMALAKRQDCKDFVGIVSTKTWDVVNTFNVETRDLADLRWSPDGSSICVWDTVLEYRILVYLMNGTRVARYAAYEDALGIKNIAWSPALKLLAIGSYDHKIRILNNVSWKPLAELEHTPTAVPSTAMIFREQERAAPPESAFLAGDASESPAPTTSTEYVIDSSPAALRLREVQTDKVLSRLGIGTLLWSPDARLLCARNDNMPEAVWVWDMTTLTLLAVLIHLAPVKSMSWDPMAREGRHRLALCTGGPRVYLWTEEAATCVDLPETSISALEVAWSPEGRHFSIADRERFCLCYTDGS